MIRQRPQALVLLLASLFFCNGCCGLIFDLGENDDEGVQVESESGGVSILLDEINALDAKKILYNPDKAKFARAPDLGVKTPSVQLKEIRGIKLDPTRAIPDLATVETRSVDLGWRVERPKSGTAKLSITLEIQNPDRDKDLPPEKINVNFKLTRIGVRMRMYNLVYEEVLLPVSPEDLKKDKGGPDPIWIRKVVELKRLFFRDLTANTKFYAFVTDEDFEKSSFSCPKKLGIAIFRKSTPVFATLIHQLVSDRID